MRRLTGQMPERSSRDLASLMSHLVWTGKYALHGDAALLSGMLISYTTLANGILHEPRQTQVSEKTIDDLE